MSTRIDRFRIVRELGSGTYGTVSLGRYNGNNYAIKRVSLEQPMQTLWEISLYNLMSHPNIVSPFEYLSTPDYKNIDIIMPEAERTLRTAITLGMTERDIRLVSWQLLSVMDYIHTNSIVHRDLKPTNILMDDIRVMVIDFGLARFLNRNTHLTSLRIQTYTHRAPEVFKTLKAIEDNGPAREIAKTISTPMDIWSVGLMILEMFLGYEYFYNRSNALSENDVSEFLLGDGIKRIDRDISLLNASPEAKDVLRGLLRSDPSMRLSASQAMRMKWFSEMRYQPAEKITYPTVKVNMESTTTKTIREAVDKLMKECGYTENVFTQMIKLVGEAYRNYPTTFTNVTVAQRYYEILIMIAGAQIFEMRSEAIPGCGLDSVANVRDIYDVFKALRFNIIIQ